MLKKKKKLPPPPWTHIGTGCHLDRSEKIIELGFPATDRKGHFWCFGTTRVGKTRVMEHIIEQDIRKGYSVVCVDPKGDLELFSKITQLALETKRLEDLMLITPIFPEHSAILDPLASYYMPEELVAHITAGVAMGREPYFFGVAYEVSLVVVQALIILAGTAGERRRHLTALRRFRTSDHLVLDHATRARLGLDALVQVLDATDHSMW